MNKNVNEDINRGEGKSGVYERRPGKPVFVSANSIDYNWGKRGGTIKRQGGGIRTTKGADKRPADTKNMCMNTTGASQGTAGNDTILPKGCARYRVYPYERQGLVTGSQPDEVRASQLGGSSPFREAAETRSARILDPRQRCIHAAEARRFIGWEVVGFIPLLPITLN